MQADELLLSVKGEVTQAGLTCTCHKSRKPLCPAASHLQLLRAPMLGVHGHQRGY